MGNLSHPGPASLSRPGITVPLHPCQLAQGVRLDRVGQPHLHYGCPCRHNLLLALQLNCLCHVLEALIRCAGGGGGVEGETLSASPNQSFTGFFIHSLLFWYSVHFSISQGCTVGLIPMSARFSLPGRDLEPLLLSVCLCLDLAGPHAPLRTPVGWGLPRL
jgi:hypothetical protein